MLLKKNIYAGFITFLLLIFFSGIKADDGYRLWFRYDKIENKALLAKGHL